MIQGVLPVGTYDGNMVGPAFTLRYMPAREDLNTMDVFRDPGHLQRRAEIPPNNPYLALTQEG